MCVCVCVCVYIYIFIYLFIYLFIYICIYTCNLYNFQTWFESMSCPTWIFPSNLNLLKFWIHLKIPPSLVYKNQQKSFIFSLDSAWPAPPQATKKITSFHSSFSSSQTSTLPTLLLTFSYNNQENFSLQILRHCWGF